MTKDLKCKENTMVKMDIHVGDHNVRIEKSPKNKKPLEMRRHRGILSREVIKKMG